MRNHGLLMPYLPPQQRLFVFAAILAGISLMVSSCRVKLPQAEGWIPMNGQLYSSKTFPRLFAAIGGRFGGDGKTTYAVPNKLNEFDLLANVGTAPGVHALYRCIAVVPVVVQLSADDGKPWGSQPAGTEAWCEGLGFVARHPNLVFDSPEWKQAESSSK